MSKRILIRCAVLPVVLLSAYGLMNRIASGADSNLTASMETFSHPDGTGYFALSLKPAVQAPVTGARDVVVLFNTSAGQTGDYRAKALESLKALLAQLPPNDRVDLMAMDLDAVQLSKGFAAPNSKETSEAVAALQARSPLGATDMEKSLSTVLGKLSADTTNPRVIVYIGDGRSAAKLLGTEAFAKLTQQLADARIPVNSYIIGARIDRQLPGALAVQTGGTVITDTDALGAAEAGRQLAAATTVAVAWPTAAVFPADILEVLPKRVPPMRADRETVLLGTFKGKGPYNVQITADVAGKPEKMDVAVTPRPSDDNNNYLAALVDRARVDGGITLPLLGTASLAEARQVVGVGVRDLRELARQALAAGNLNSAEKLVGEALRRDPNDTEAQAIKGAVAKRRAAGMVVTPVAATTAVPPPPPAPSMPQSQPSTASDDLNLVGTDANEPPPGTLAESFEHDRRIIAQMIQTEVQNAISHARSLMSTDPDSASQELKLTLEKVRQTPELNPEVRDQLVDVLQTGLRQAARQKVEVEHARQQRLENAAAGKEQQLIAENLIRNQQKVEQLMNRFNSLMQEGRYRLAEESAAAEAQAILPDSPVPALAVLEARQVGYYQNFMALRVARQKGVVDTLYQVERSHIPFPDDPPIVYPDAEVWQQLTTRRKDRWGSVDLATPGPAEKQIQKALKSPTELSFTDTPLTDVILYLKDLHGIEIQLDQRALTEAGVETSTPVTVNLKGITLRSALRILLRELNLTYVIENEVLMITTPEEAEARLITKVYPVADLVIPVQCEYGHDGWHGWRHDGRHGWRHGWRHGRRHGRRHDGRHGWRYGRHGWRHGNVQPAARPAAEGAAGRLPGLCRQG